MTGLLESLRLSLMDAAIARRTLSWWYTAIVAVFFIVDRRKKRAYGIVFDASTLRPLSFAIVALLRPGGAVTRTAVTDEKGRYRIAASEGDYRLAITRPGYRSVSGRFGERRAIGPYRDLYAGKTVAVRYRNPIVSADIPLEPENPGRRTWAVLAEIAWRRFDIYVKALFLSLTALWAIEAPGSRAMALLSIEAGVYVVCAIRWSSGRRWGIVKNARSGKSVPYAKVELIDAVTSQLIESSATDLLGRYNFLVEDFRRMYIRCRRPGYRSFRSDTLRFFGLRSEKIDLVGIDILLDPDPAMSAKKRGEMFSILEVSHEEYEAERQAMMSKKDGGSDVNAS